MRRIIVLTHMLLGLFFLPMGLLYAITGGLYGLDVKGNYRTTNYDVPLEAPLSGELSAMVAIVERELHDRGIPFPSGSARIRKGGTSYYLEWTGSRRDVELHPTDDPVQASLHVKETTLHRLAVQLHKAKGGFAFKLYAAAWMVALVGLTLSGAWMALTLPKYWRLSAITLAAGLVVFAVLALVS